MTMGQRVAALARGTYGHAGLAITAPRMSAGEIDQRNTDKGINATETDKKEQDRHEHEMARIDAEAKRAGSVRDQRARAEAEFAAARDRADEDHTHRLTEQNNAAKQNGKIKPINNDGPDPERENLLTRARAERAPSSWKLIGQRRMRFGAWKTKRSMPASKAMTC